MIESKILRWGESPGLSTGALNAITNAAKRGRGRFDHTEEEERCSQRQSLGDVAPSQGMTAAPETGKRQEKILPWSLQRKPGQLTL